jgi:hypothetical protein
VTSVPWQLDSSQARAANEPGVDPKRAHRSAYGDEEFGPDDVPPPSAPPVEPISPTTVGVASKNAATPTGS